MRLPNASKGIAVADLVVEVTPVAARAKEGFPSVRWEAEKLIRLSIVKLKRQRSRVGVIARSVQRLASNVEGRSRSRLGLTDGAGLHFGVEGLLLPLAIGCQTTSRPQQREAGQRSLGGALLFLASKTSKESGDCHA